MIESQQIEWPQIQQGQWDYQETRKENYDTKLLIANETRSFFSGNAIDSLYLYWKSAFTVSQKQWNRAKELAIDCVEKDGYKHFDIIGVFGGELGAFCSGKAFSEKMIQHSFLDFGQNYKERSRLLLSKSDSILTDTLLLRSISQKHCYYFLIRRLHIYFSAGNYTLLSLKISGIMLRKWQEST